MYYITETNNNKKRFPNDFELKYNIIVQSFFTLTHHPFLAHSPASPEKSQLGHLGQFTKQFFTKSHF